MDWDKFLHPLIGERRGRDFFVGAVLCGFVLMVMALGDVYLDGLGRLAGFFAGAGLMAGAACTLALAYGEWPEEIRFALKVAARVGFLPLAPCFVLIELPYLLEEVGAWVCVALSCLTIVPFGLSLIRLIWKKRTSHQ